MAQSGNADVIKEFLVALGFQLDTNSLGKMETAIGKVAGLAFSFAAAMAGAAGAMTAFVARTAKGADDLYWASIRTRDGVAAIKDFQLSVAKAGGSAEGALSALESMSRYLRTTPGGENFLHMLGIQTRDLNGQLRSAKDILLDFAKSNRFSYWQQARIAERFGIDEKTLYAIRTGALTTSTAVSSMYEKAGISSDQLADHLHALNLQTLDVEAKFGVLADIIASKLLPIASRVLDWTESAVLWLASLNKSADSLGGTLEIRLAEGLAAVLAVATLLAPAIYTIAAAVGVLTAASSPWIVGIGAAVVAVTLLSKALGVVPAILYGLSAATLAWGVAIASTPVGWLALGLAALGAAAELVIANWDKVRVYWHGLVEELKAGWNEAVSVLHLPPSWKAKPGASPAAQPPTAPPVPAGHAATTRQPSAPPPSAEYRLPGGMRYEDLPAFERLKFPPPATGSPSNAPAGETATRQAMGFFRAAGYSLAQSAGIVANFIRESSLNPQAIGDKGTSFGIAQWHDPKRQVAFASMFGHDILHGTLDEQLKFVLAELTSGAMKAVGVAVRGATSAAEAAAIFSNRFEIPKDKSGEAALRGHLAEGLLNTSPLTAGPVTNNYSSVNAPTNITITSPDPQSAGKYVGTEMRRRNADIIRNFAPIAR